MPYARFPSSLLWNRDACVIPPPSGWALLASTKVTPARLVAECHLLMAGLPHLHQARMVGLVARTLRMVVPVAIAVALVTAGRPVMGVMEVMEAMADIVDMEVMADMEVMGVRMGVLMVDRVAVIMDRMTVVRRMNRGEIVPVMMDRSHLRFHNG